jgi:DNA-binding LacI/PurR family transcriptional regulator
MRDVAERVGVSVNTVSKVMNGSRSDTRVSEATRDRIRTVAAEIGYTPSAVARSLQRKRTNTIGVYTGADPFIADSVFTASILSGLQRGSAEFEKDLLLRGRFPATSRETWAVTYTEMTDGRIDGLILMSGPDDTLTLRLRDSHLSVVALVEEIPGVPSVVADEVLGSQLLAGHLASLGHRRILYQASPNPRPSNVLRWMAFREAAAGLGMSVETHHPQGHQEPFSEAQRARLALPESERPTAVACSADYLSFPLLEDCERLGIRVPEDLAFVGFDGIELVLNAPPKHRLTTIRPHWGNIAWRAVEVLSRVMAGKEAPERTVMPVELVTGDTT